MVRSLDRKLLRDLVRLWPQALAIAMVMAAGVATLILAVGAHQSLDETRAAYYERNRFADVFAEATRAPNRLGDAIAAIPGVSAVETRIVEVALLDIPGMSEPASAQLVSLPDIGRPVLNRLYMREGRRPIVGDENEVVVNEAFAEAHGFTIGSRFKALLKGAKREVRVVGIALSPEFIYTIGPGDLMPDPRRFGIVWMSEKTLAAAYDLDGAFSNVAVALLRDANEDAVIDALDDLLARYGGAGAYGRKDQISHAFIDAELEQLAAMARVLPPIFLIVAAFLVNMTMSRLVALEREQIGLLKAIGYGNGAIGMHYLKFVLAIAVVGTLIGAIAGTWLGIGLARMYGDFFNFPFLIFRKDPSIYVIAVLVTVVTAGVGALKTVSGIARLSPAVAMAPPAPAIYSRSPFWRIARLIGLPQSLTMVIRHLVHVPVRTGSAILGIALGVSIVIASIWAYPSIDFMVDVTFFRADRQDASISFSETKRIAAAYEVARLPGVLAVEPFRSVPVRIRFGHKERRVSVLGKPADATLSRVIDMDLRPLTMPETGIVLSDMLARTIGARTGDIVEMDLLEGDRRTVQVPVTATVEGFIGLSAYMELSALNRLKREGALISGVYFSLDTARQDALYAEITDIPAANFIALQKVSLQKFRETLAENIFIMTFVYVTLASIIAFGVVYNSARISLSERGRELASLRVLGFTRAEVSRILLLELAIVTFLAQPLGCLIGYGFAYAIVTGFESELYQVPFVLTPDIFAWSSIVVLSAAAISALIVRRRIDRLDLIEVLKTRE
ncbi:putative ABC transport system permease protein [Rhodobium orientis]|uniref:ABC transporter permease n=1 Tax=Rhodobium orientis TaxID=34017 RepID=UPI0018553D98|nr:ABC transporter permease [Rhodobium orientis]MBB4302001.1 putative ABC transport system permease protein [Rhodobium orientis]